MKSLIGNILFATSLLLALISSPVSAATDYVCQPGGADVTDSDCIIASHALLMSQERCSGKVQITENVVTAKHGGCCAAMYVAKYPTPPATTVYHSIDYIGLEFAKGIRKCLRGVVALDNGVTLVHNRESCKGNYVGKRGGATIPRIPAEPLEARDEDDTVALEPTELQPEDKDLEARSGVDLCTRVPQTAIITVDRLSDSALHLVRSTTGSGTGAALATWFIQGAWAGLFIKFKDNLNNSNYLDWTYVGNTWFYSVSMHIGKGVANWAAVKRLVGEQAMDEIIHKIVEDAASLGVAAITYVIRNDNTGDFVAKFKVTNLP